MVSLQMRRLLVNINSFTNKFQNKRFYTDATALGFFTYPFSSRII